jgi:hypothetical protein
VGLHGIHLSFARGRPSQLRSDAIGVASGQLGAVGSASIYRGETKDKAWILLAPALLNICQFDLDATVVLAAIGAQGRGPQCIHRPRAVDPGAAGDGGRCLAHVSTTPVIVGPDGLCSLRSSVVGT